jgi:hypothetical protein
LGERSRVALRDDGAPLPGGLPGDFAYATPSIPSPPNALTARWAMASLALRFAPTLAQQ